MTSAKEIFERRLKLAVWDATLEVQDRARQEHRYTNDSHKLEREGILVHFEEQGMVGVVSLNPLVRYAKYVHEGTRAHEILPRNRKALRWPVGKGNFAFAKRVRHPGYKGDPFLYRALDNSQARIDAIFDRQLDLAVKEVMECF